MIKRPPALWLIFCISLLGFAGGSDAATSALWGESGELWSPESRLPDFSRAGYQGGDVPIPVLPVVTNVKNFGAKGDGIADDSAAFLNALQATENGAVFIPAGRYKITEQIKVNKNNVAFRGAGQDLTTLYFPQSLNDTVGPAEDNAPGGSWSWSGGYFQVSGYNRGKKLAAVTAAAQRGGTTLVVSTVAGLSKGQRIRVITWNPDGSWANYLFGNQLTGPSDMIGTKGSDFPCKIVAIQGNTLTIDRPLRTDIRLPWNPEIDSDLPTLENIGFEDMTLEFPDVPYPGHHNEPGFNGFDLRSTQHCWIRRIRFINCDSGIFIHENAWFNTVQSVRFSAASRRFVTGYDYLPEHPYAIAGHHGIVTLSYAMDNLIRDFHFDVRMIHELSLENQSTGNVYAHGDGLDMVLDHHRRAPYANLFTDINVGLGNRLWESGGDHEDGPESGGWETFWDIRAAAPFGLPDKWEFKAVLLHLVGITTNLVTSTPVNGNWVEAFVPSSLVPPDLHLAQVAFRKGGSPDDTTSPSVPSGLAASAASTTQINLSWGASTDNVGVTGYKVFVNGSFLAATGSRSYSHTGLTPSTEYSYSVAAHDAANNTSAVSAAVKATTQSPQPSPPAITSAGSAAGAVGAVFNYMIEATNNPVSFSSTVLPPGLSINSATGQISGTPSATGAFPVTLTARNAYGAGTITLTITVSTVVDKTPPLAPAALEPVAVSSTQINLAWTASKDPQGSVAGYAIYRYGSKIGVSTATSYKDKNLTPSTRYRYSVAAYDAAGNYSPPSEVRSATTLSPLVPSVPVGLTLTSVSPFRVNLSWQASTVREGTVTGYHVYRNSVLITDVPTVSLSDGGLTPGDTYSYRIAAYDNRGVASALSASITVKTPAASGLPAPTLDLPDYLPVNGTLSAGYPAQYNYAAFEWTITPQDATGSPGARAAASRSAGSPGATFKTTGRTASLGPHLLSAGPYMIAVRAVDADGQASPRAQSPVTLVLADLAAVRVYPNPWRAGKHRPSMTFDRLPTGSVIKVFTVSGHFVKTINPAGDSVSWDLHNDSGDLVASGIYLYVVVTPDGSQIQDQLVIIR